MIEPVQHGEALLAEIHGTHPARGTVAIWWLGQSGYLIKSRFGMLVVAPYLAVLSAHEGLDTDARPSSLSWVRHRGRWPAPVSLRGHAGVRAPARPARPGPVRCPVPPDQRPRPGEGGPGEHDGGRGRRGGVAGAAPYVIAHHYQMFTFNTVPVAEFEAEARWLARGVEPRVLRCGDHWEIKR